jgi:predicted nucleotidyltransferase
MLTETAPPADTRELDAVRDALAQEPGIRLAIVFGSVAKGTARATSDIDVAVLTQSPLTAIDKIHLIEIIAQAAGRPVDLIDLATAGQPLLSQVLAHGKRVLGTAHTHADVATRSLLDAADFLPYVERLLKHRRQAWTG